MKSSVIYNDFSSVHKFTALDGEAPKSDAYLLIPEGLYEVQFINADPIVKVFGPDELRLYLHWKIVQQGPYFEIVLFQSFKHYPRWPFSSKFYCNWTVANNGQKPKKRTRMSMSVFKNKIFLAQVGTARPKYREGSLKGKEKPSCMQYSVVEQLLEITGP